MNRLRDCEWCAGEESLEVELVRRFLLRLPADEPRRPWTAEECHWARSLWSVKRRSESTSRVVHTEECVRSQEERTFEWWSVAAWARQGIFPPPLEGEVYVWGGRLTPARLLLLQGAFESRRRPIDVTLSDEESIDGQREEWQAVLADVEERFPVGDPVVLCDCPVVADAEPCALRDGSRARDVERQQIPGWRERSSVASGCDQSSLRSRESEDV